MTYYFTANYLPHLTEMESHNLPFALPLFIYPDLAKKLQKQVKNPIVKHMIKNHTHCHSLAQYRVIITSHQVEQTAFKLWNSKDPGFISATFKYHDVF